MVRRIADESGAMLIEIMMSALILGIIALGVMKTFDVAATASGDNKHRAAAANIAENELERIRGMRISQVTALTGTPQTVTQNGVSYTRTSTATWVSQPTTGSICAGVDGPPTYLRVSVSVSWPGRATKPVTVTSLIAPGARGTLSTQGALVIKIVDINDNPVAGVPVNIGGGAPQGVTDANGCVSWSPLTAGTYSMTASKSGYVTPDNGSSLSESISVAGQDVTSRQYTYSQGGTISGTFYSVRSGANVASYPTRVSIAHPSKPTQRLNVSGGTFSANLAPDPSAYTVYAGNCDAARPPVAYETSATVNPGGTASVQVRMPGIDAQTEIAGDDTSGRITVTDVCGTTYDRNTTAASGGRLADPGFPYSASNIAVCGQVTVTGGLNWFGFFALTNGNYRKRVSIPNNDWPSSGADDGDFNLTSYWLIWARPGNDFDSGSCP